MSSSSSNIPDFNYIGSHNSSDEGTRHFFMLRSVYSKYTAVNGKEVDYFLVYTSTGKNTKGICGKILCIIPCFGTMVQWTDIPEDFRKQTGSTKMHTLISPIIKIDYFKGIQRYIKNPQILKNYEKSREMFLSSETIRPDLLRRFFNDPKGEIDLREYRDLKVKLGSNSFLSDIIIYRDKIYEYVSNGEKKFFEDLSYINRVIGSNNFYGIDLSILPSYSKLMSECIEKYKPNYPYFCTLPELFVGYNHAEYAGNIIKELIRKLKNDKNKKDKYLALINSPPEHIIYKVLNAF